jgi:hypothetical protein
MSDTSPRNQRALQYNAPKAPPRQPKPGELLFEFHVARTHKFYLAELVDRGKWGALKHKSSKRPTTSFAATDFPIVCRRRDGPKRRESTWTLVIARPATEGR